MKIQVLLGLAVALCAQATFGKEKARPTKKVVTASELMYWMKNACPATCFKLTSYLAVMVNCRQSVLPRIQDNASLWTNDVCDECTLKQEELECPLLGCNDDFNDLIQDDPHMVGLLGQNIDWAGVDSAWYCLLSDGPDFHVNVRLSAPMPGDFPDRELISALSILSDDGRSSLMVKVKNPYSIDATGCPDSSSVPCLADGGLCILINGEESIAMQAPAENVRLPGSSPVVVSTANLPPECRPSSGDRIWATQFAEMMTNRRSPRLDSVSFDDWILQPDSLAAPTWCAKFLEEGGMARLLSTRSEHATLRVETPAATVRINVGVNYQDLEAAPDGTVMVPELEFWRTDLGFDSLRLSSKVGGLMGDTSRFGIDDKGVPVTSGLGVLHGPVESYRVAGPFSRNFEKGNINASELNTKEV